MLGLFGKIKKFNTSQWYAFVRKNGRISQVNRNPNLEIAIGRIENCVIRGIGPAIILCSGHSETPQIIMAVASVKMDQHFPQFTLIVTLLEQVGQCTSPESAATDVR